MTKEAVGDVFAWLSKNEEGGLEDAVNALGLAMLSELEIKKLVDEAVKANEAAVERLGAVDWTPNSH